MVQETHFTDEHFTPTAITTEFPIKVTIVGHTFVAGNAIRATKFYKYPVADSPGMEQLNDRLFYVNLIDGNDFKLFDEFGNGIDGRNYTAFVNNGKAQFTLTGPRLYTENHIV